VTRTDAWRDRLAALSPRQLPLLPKILVAFLVVLALATVLTQLFETRLVRAELDEHARTLFGQQAEVFDRSLEQEVSQTGVLMRQFLEAQYGTGAGTVTPSDLVRDLDEPGATEAARTALGNLRRAAGLQFGGIVDVESGTLPVVLARRERIADVDPDVAARVFDDTAETSQRVVPLVDGGYGLAYVLPVGRASKTPALHVIGVPLDDQQARDFARRTGVDDVEIVVGDTVIASTTGRNQEGALEDPGLVRTTQDLDDGRLIRYRALGADRPWDHPTAIGLIVDDPLAELDAALARTRVLVILLMVAVGGALALAAAGMMARPLKRLTETAAAIADGDLERSFSIEWRQDEIGTLADALERMRRALRAQLLVIHRQAVALQDASRRIVGVQDAERQRIAGELHDGIQQQLVVLRMQVGVARSQLAQEPALVDAVTESLAASIEHLLDDVRATARALFPSILADRGLSGALFSLAGRVELPLDLDIAPDPLPRLDLEVETNAFFLVSEAVTNALKHADATRIAVTVRLEGTTLLIEVEDDGLGFDPTTVAHSGGLSHLRDRVSALGGRLHLASEPGGGARVLAKLPTDGNGGLPQPGVLVPLVASARRPLQEEQHGGDPAVEVDVLGEPELAEDGVDVLLDRAFADRQFPRDGGVASP
jgi:signal transduction histidine kinase